MLLASLRDAFVMGVVVRWLSEVRATPPDHKFKMNRTPAGVPALSVYAIDIHKPQLSSNFRHQGRKTESTNDNLLLHMQHEFGQHKQPPSRFHPMPLWGISNRRGYSTSLTLWLVHKLQRGCVLQPRVESSDTERVQPVRTNDNLLWHMQQKVVMKTTALKIPSDPILGRSC